MTIKSNNLQFRENSTNLWNITILANSVQGSTSSVASETTPGDEEYEYQEMREGKNNDTHGILITENPDQTNAHAINSFDSKVVIFSILILFIREVIPHFNA